MQLHTMDNSNPKRARRTPGPSMKIGPIKAAELAADYYEKDAPVLKLAFKYGICQRTLYSTLRYYGYLAPADSPRKRVRSTGGSTEKG